MDTNTSSSDSGQRPAKPGCQHAETHNAGIKLLREIVSEKRSPVDESELRATSTKNTLTTLTSEPVRLTPAVNTRNSNEFSDAAQNKSVLSITGEPTVSKAYEEAGRDDMIAGVDSVHTITRRLKALLSSTASADQDTNLSGRESTGLQDKGSEGLVPHILQPHNTGSAAANPNEKNSSISGAEPGPRNDTEESMVTTTVALPQPKHPSVTTGSTQKIHAAPEPPTTEPSLFLQSADAIGSAWYAEDETCKTPSGHKMNQ